MTSLPFANHVFPSLERQEILIKASGNKAK